MKWWSSNPQTVTGTYLGSRTNAYTIFLSPHPTRSNLILDHFPPPPRPISYCPPIFHLSLPLLSLSLYPLLPTHLAQSCNDCPPGRRSTSWWTKVVSQASPCLPSSVRLPPLSVLDLHSGFCQPQGSPVSGYLTPSSCLLQSSTPILHRAVLERQYIPLPVPSGGVVFFFPLSCASASTSPIYSPSSLGFF